MSAEADGKSVADDAAPINAWAAMSKGGTVEPYTYVPEPLGAHEIEITILYCGICHVRCAC